MSHEWVFSTLGLGSSAGFWLFLPLPLPFCCVEELALPMRAIQLSGEVLSTDEAASAELREAEAAHRTCNSRHLFKSRTHDTLRLSRATA